MPALLVLHGITMSGRSMLRLLGPIGDALAAQGLELVAPDAGVRLDEARLARVLHWIDRGYRARAQRADAVFRAGAFWDAEGPGDHLDWFDGSTIDGVTTYAGLEAGLAAIREALRGREVVGVLGFSQGAAMAALVAGLARAGHLPFAAPLRFAVLLSGFRPTFAAPRFDPSPWPVGDLPALMITGRDDPLFADAATIGALAAEFTDPEVHVVDGLGHELPREPLWVDRIAAFVAEHVGAHVGGTTSSAEAEGPA